jgi:hypothetical protein
VPVRSKAEHWRALAAEALAAAEQMADPETRATTPNTAKGYHTMAEQAEAHDAALGEVAAKPLPQTSPALSPHAGSRPAGRRCFR